MTLIACGPFLRESLESGATLRQLAGDVLRDTPSVSLAPGVNDDNTCRWEGREGAWLTCDKSLMDS